MSKQINLKDGTTIEVVRCGDYVSLSVSEDNGGMRYDYESSDVSIHMTQREATLLCEALLGISIEDSVNTWVHLAHH